MPYSGQGGFTTPIFFGLISLLFSFGKGLVFFAPGLLLPVRRACRDLRARTGTNVPAIFGLWLSFLIGILLLYSIYWNWHGGYFWGPRYLLFASIPASFALAVYLQREGLSLPVNLAVLAVLALSLWVGIDGVVYGAAFNGDDAVRNVCLNQYPSFETPLCYYTPEFSVLWFPFVFHPSISREKLFFLVYELLVALVLLSPLLVRIGRQLGGEARRFALSGERVRF
jgi:hypothetical protein